MTTNTYTKPAASVLAGDIIDVPNHGPMTAGGPAVLIEGDDTDVYVVPLFRSSYTQPVSVTFDYDDVVTVTIR